MRSVVPRADSRTASSGDALAPVWKALSDPTRRAILDLLRDGARTTTEIVERFPQLTRFGVMKHLDVLREASLVITHAQGRERINAINAVPIRQIYERWITPFAGMWATQLLSLKRDIETDA
ncbi:MAG: winged helix-turn-helix transcriptional regulator [Candidatus Hydrogenedentes bacterium]|nr:winged helix-turn-helix transcriptional regulator [Candidatus Hydrogenedentota bacterium]